MLDFRSLVLLGDGKDFHFLRILCMVPLRPLRLRIVSICICVKSLPKRRPIQATGPQ